LFGFNDEEILAIVKILLMGDGITLSRGDQPLGLTIGRRPT